MEPHLVTRAHFVGCPLVAGDGLDAPKASFIAMDCPQQLRLHAGERGSVVSLPLNWLSDGVPEVLCTCIVLESGHEYSHASRSPTRQVAAGNVQVASYGPLSAKA
jgi:hypothetical protein